METYQDDLKTAAELPLPWNKLDGCNILITGETGLIGSCLVEVLMSRVGHNYHIYAAGRDEKRAKMRFRSFENAPTFHFLTYDVMHPLPGNIEFQYIVNAASDASPASFVFKPVEVILCNVMGVANLLDYGRLHGLRRFLYVSSGEVYGEGNGRKFTEDYSGYVDCTKSRSCYPVSKRAAETLCVSYMAEYGIEPVIARLSHTYGPNFTESDNRVYAQFIRNVLRGEDIVLKSDGCQYRSWCYVVDCVSALLYILLCGDGGRAYNVADDQSNITIRELAEMIASIADRKVVYEKPSDIEFLGRNIVTQSTFDTSRLEALGWKIQGTMRKKMERVISWVKYNK